jgi:hypothetical protein
MGQIISQYIETNSGTTPKGIEIWNNTSSTLNFSTNNLVIKKGTNGGTPSADFTLSSGTLASGAVIVIGTSDLQTVTENNGAVFYLKAFTFNGDDALEVWYGSTKTDVFGTPGSDPGSAWTGNGVSTKAQNIALKSGITSGDTDGWTDPSTRFTTVNTNPSGSGGDEGFGIAPVSSSGPDNPTNFTATTFSTSQINLSWTQNGNNNDVMVAWSSDGTFGTPTDGTTYSVGSSITGGGTVIFNGNGTTHSHTSLTAGTHYYYKAWSVDGSTNYSSGVTADATTIPKIMITEVMQNPNDVTDANGEWFEIYNYGSTTVDINGYVIKDAGSDSHTINNGGALNIAAGSFLVLGINSTTSTNGGVPVDYQYSGITLNNGADEIILYMTDGTTEVDRVEWDGGPNWPDPTGASMIFTGQTTDDNNVGSNWTTSIKRENNFSNPTGTETDYGSPGKNGLYQNLIFSTTWTGTGNWNDGNGVGKSNWSNGSPGKKTSVVIDGAITIDANLSNPAKSKDLTINSGKSLSIDPDKALTINGNLTNNGTLTVQSTSAGNGSLIINGTVTGSATVQRYIAAHTSASGSGNGWHEIGCPVASFDPSGTDWDPTNTGTSNDLYYWGEANNQWMNYRTSTFNISPDKGYLVANDANLYHEFVGPINSTDVTAHLTRTAGQGEGWNLIGNPFPSAIKWYDASASNKNDWGTDINGGKIAATAEIWDEANGNYHAISAGEIIPSTNAVFIQVNNGYTTADITIPASARTHDATGNYKSALAAHPQETLTFNITDDANSFADKSILGFKPNATKDWDIAFDAHKLMSMVKTAPQIWTVSKNQKFLVNYLPEPTASEDIPLHFKPGVSTVYHLTFNGVDSFNGTSFVLEDLKTGEKIDLNNTDSYDFSADKGDDVNRFVLHINGVTAVPSVNKTDGIQVFAYGNTVYLHGEKVLNGKVFIFNTLGQKVYEGLLNGAVRQQIRLDQRQGIYFVRLEVNNLVVTQKVFIK